MSHPIMWYEDQSPKLKELLDLNGYDEEEFLDCLPEAAHTKEQKLEWMNDFLRSTGSGDLQVIDVRESVNSDDLFEWRFEGDPIIKSVE